MKVKELVEMLSNYPRQDDYISVCLNQEGDTTYYWYRFTGIRSHEGIRVLHLMGTSDKGALLEIPPEKIEVERKIE